MNVCVCTAAGVCVCGHVSVGKGVGGAYAHGCDCVNECVCRVVDEREFVHARMCDWVCLSGVNM